MEKQAEELIVALCNEATAKQFGLITRRQLTEAGISTWQLHRLFAASRLVKILPGVFAFPGSFKTRERALAAACLWYGEASHRDAVGPLNRARVAPASGSVTARPGSDARGPGEGAGGSPAETRVLLALPERSVAVSHLSAAAVWELQGIEVDESRVDVLREGSRCNPAHPAIRTHWTDHLPDSEVAERNGLRVTTPLRTIVDLAPLVSDHVLELAILDAIAREHFTPAQLEARVAAARREALPGLSKLDVVLQRAGFGVATESPLEREVLQILLDWGLHPAGQHDLFRMPARIFVGRYDFVFKQERVLVEVDSKKWHRAWKDKIRDGEKTDGGVALGYEVVRVRKRDLHGPGRRAFKRRLQVALATATVRAAMTWPRSLLVPAKRKAPKVGPSPASSFASPKRSGQGAA